ncbi:hypothetical protein AC480_00810 [miscellaneous Crenarchaeota group archaeon SMTZ1-55]|nr:MAG: hypothetical protein AC480_00810 [miscellaneous Crenarchaeota group archaeon SMTZ1-55]
MSRTTEHLQNIADKLTTLKNTSELMINLAYSSLLFNSRELAEEVQLLEERIDKLQTEFELLVLASGFTPEESQDYLGLMRLGVTTERIADAAARIADVVLRGLEPHPVMRLVIEEAEETVTRVQVSQHSPLVGKTLRDAKIPAETGMWLLVIRREGDWIRPKPETLIREGDVLVASGYAEGEDDFVRLASGKN